MAKPTPQQCHALTTYFISKAEAATGNKARVNRNKARWAFESILMDMTTAEVHQLIDYYVDHFTDTPDLEWFLWNYEKVQDKQEAAAKEHEIIVARRAETARRVEEWNKRWKK